MIKSSKRRHTKEGYERALLLREQGKKHAEISDELGISIRTIQGWFYSSTKPRCISDTWKESAKRKIGNLGEYTKRHPIYPEELTGPEQAYLLGAYLGDGNSHNGFDMQVKDINFATYVAELISKVSKTQVVAEEYERKRSWGVEHGYRVRLSRRDLKDWLETATDNKRGIPLLRTEKEIWWFLSGFIDSEGSVKKNGDNHSESNVRIELSQKGDRVLEQIKEAIRRIGISSRVSRDREDYYKLFIYNKVNFGRLLELGSLRISYKKDKLAFAVNNDGRRRPISGRAP